MNKIIIAFVIYTYFFCNLGNTCLRLNENGIKQFSLIPLFSEGIIGPIRSLILLIYYGNLIDIGKYLLWIFTSLSNIFGAIIFVYYINKIFSNNF